MPTYVNKSKDMGIIRLENGESFYLRRGQKATVTGKVKFKSDKVVEVKEQKKETKKSSGE